MNKEDILKSVYEDFFGIRKIEKQNEKLKEEIRTLSGIDVDKDIPYIEVKEKTADKNLQTEISKEDKDKKMEELLKKIDKIYIDEKSKDILRKIVEYIRKYNEKIETQYISFNMCVYTNNKETFENVLKILHTAINFFKYTPKGDIAIISTYDLKNSDDIIKIYNSNNNVIAFENLKFLETKDSTEKEKMLYKLYENIVEKEKNTLTILYAKNKDELKEIFLSSKELNNEFSTFEITGVEPEIQEIYNEITQRISSSMEVKEDLQIKLLDYISATYHSTELSYPEYRDKLVQKITFTKQIPEYEQNKSLEEIFEELDSLVGLEKVKKMLRELVDLIELKEKSKDILKLKSINLHMVFLGNPGTGKTTVARIISNILYELKYIKQNKLIEVTSKDLVAEYVGQTAIKTMSVIQKALGGVLFIDEAYSLASGKGQGNSYNEEAVATLIQAMENNRDNLVVIFAGYTKEMQDFLNLNSGIVSRIGYTVEFEDYTTEELLKIFKSMTEKSGFIVSKDAIEKVRNVIEENRNTKNFGNARFVRNIYEKTIVQHASNTKNKKSKKALKTIEKEDISTENLIKM